MALDLVAALDSVRNCWSIVSCAAYLLEYNEMTEYLIRITRSFMDKETKEDVAPGTLFATPDAQRASTIVNMKLGTFAGIRHPGRTGNRILIHQKYCYKIGGIETANRAIAETFKDRNIVFVFGSGDEAQIKALGKYHDVIIDDGHDTYDCDVAIFTNYDSAPAIMDRIRARKVYQQIHADFENLRKMPEWSHFVWHPNPRVDKVLAVSETAAKALHSAYNVDSVVVPNILPSEPEQPLVLIALTRATPEKGVDRLVKLLKRLDASEKDYVLFMCASEEQAKDGDQIYLRENPRVIHVKPTPYSRALLRAADYLVQLSYNESYCYSVREALQAGVPCLVSDIPELRKLITDGKNGFIYSDDFDIEKLWTKPKPARRSEKVSPLWKEVLDGKL